MRIDTVRGCCSMMTISDNPEFEGVLSKKEFSKCLNVAISYYCVINNSVLCNSSIKTLVMISNRRPTFFLRHRKLPFFKFAYKYVGNSDYAYVYHFDFGRYGNMSRFLSKFNK